MIRGLKSDEEYTLHEDFAFIDYTLTSDITFTIDDSDKPAKVVKKDEITKVKISKADATTGEDQKVIMEDTGKPNETVETGTDHLLRGVIQDNGRIDRREISGNRDSIKRYKRNGS